MRLDCVAIQALVDTSKASTRRWLAAEPADTLGQSVDRAVARAEGLLPLLLPVSNRCLADRHWAAIFALLPVRRACSTRTRQPAAWCLRAPEPGCRLSLTAGTRSTMCT